MLQKFQFPWRFLSISVFLASILGGIQIWLVPSKYKRYVVVLLVLIILFLNKDYWHVKEYMYKPESFFTSVYYGTTDTGESAPIWSVRFMEKESSTHLEAVEGSAKITEIKRSSIFHSYLVDVDERVRMRENTLYFPGWKVYVDKREVSVQFQDPRHRGLMTFFVEKGKHPVVIEFQDTKVRRFANMISLVSFFGMAIIYIFFYLKKRIT